ncbi:MAG: hypothetical protein ACKV0T_26590 [Planctomycetales bacterium]
MAGARVIDTIQITDTLRQHVQGLQVPFTGDGIHAILDPAESDDTAGAGGKLATIQRPDGSETTWIIAGTQTCHGVPSFYFQNMTSDALPRLSTICWD